MMAAYVGAFAGLQLLPFLFHHTSTQLKATLSLMYMIKKLFVNICKMHEAAVYISRS